MSSNPKHSLVPHAEATKLKRSRVPHAEATEKALARLRAMSPDEARETFVSSGILTPDGELAAAYGGATEAEATPSPLATG